MPLTSSAKRVSMGRVVSGVVLPCKGLKRAQCGETLRSYLGRKSQPCCKNEPMTNHKLLMSVNVFSSSSGFGSQGCGLSHSDGVTLEMKEQEPLPDVAPLPSLRA